MVEDLTEKLIILKFQEVLVEIVLVLDLCLDFVGFILVFVVFVVFVVFIVFCVCLGVKFELVESWVGCQVCEVPSLRASTLCRLTYSHKVARFTCFGLSHGLVFGLFVGNLIPHFIRNVFLQVTCGATMKEFDSRRVKSHCLDGFACRKVFEDVVSHGYQ